MVNKLELVATCVGVVNNPAHVQQFSNGKDVDSVIRGKFFEIMGTEKPTMKDIRRHKVEIFEIMEEVLTETYLKGVNEDEFFMRFADIRNIALGDSQEFFMEDDGVVIVSEHAGNHWGITRQKMEGGASFGVKTKSYSAGIYGDFFLFVTNRLSFGKLVNKVAKGIQDKIYSEVAASFASATATLPAAFQATGTYAEAELIELVSHVEAATGSEPVVVGTRIGLAKITAGLNTALYSDAMKNELANTGRVTNVNGMTLVQLPAVHKANSFDFAYDDNQLLVLPTNDDKFIKVVFQGEDMVRERTENTANQDMSFEYLFLTNFGVKSVFSSLFGIYKLA
jgi:hypothetical protein